ncbi:MAG: cation:proton antiporter domain-containing protein, partial [Planctomycetota bacterium]|jgi:NhaP-type Na+/H+ or K+/H+ antiporter
VDDIYVIVAHSVIVGLYVGHQVNVAWQVVSVPISLLLGVLGGLGIGLFLYHFFNRFNPRATKRLLVLVALSVLLVRLEHLLAGHVPFAGLVSAMAIGFIILEKDEHMAHEISAKLAKVWVFAEIILFSMVGAQVNIEVAWNAGLAAAAVIALGLIARGIGVQMCLLQSKLNRKERLFVMVSFFPKATVQAAIGASPLMAMKMAGMDTAPGEIILAAAVLSIVLTAPAGAWAISLMGDRFLKVSPQAQYDAYNAVIESNPDSKKR